MKRKLSLLPCKRSSCYLQKSQNLRGGVGGKESRCYSKMPALRGDSGRPVTKTAFLLLISSKCLIDMQGGVEQRKEKLARQLQEKALARGWSAPGSGTNLIQMPKNPLKLLGQVFILVQSKQNHWDWHA